MSRESILQLSIQKENLENEIKSLVEYLTAPGMPGLKGPLIDHEGFPRGDLDLYSIRQARQKFITLNNDHTALMNRIESELHSYFGNQSSVPIESHKPIESEVAVSLQDNPVPFAEITEVSPGSPAESAGLKVSDRLVSFGPINYLNSNQLLGLQEFVKHAEGTEVRVSLLRSGIFISLILKPARWTGNGTIGCRFRPI